MSRDRFKKIPGRADDTYVVTDGDTGEEIGEVRAGRIGRRANGGQGDDRGNGQPNSRPSWTFREPGGEWDRTHYRSQAEAARKLRKG